MFGVFERPPTTGQTYPCTVEDISAQLSRLLPHWKKHEVERWLVVEMAFGMEVERPGSRWLCRWEPERLRVFTLQHVLLHEVGHHVYWMQRRREGFASNPSTQVNEQFAEDYVLRHYCPW